MKNNEFAAPVFRPSASLTIQKEVDKDPLILKTDTTEEKRKSAWSRRLRAVAELISCLAMYLNNIKSEYKHF